MTHVVLITPWLEEPDDDRAIAARAHVAAYAGQGLRVHVIAPPGPGARPAFECEAGIEVHRLDVDATEKPPAFAARALQRAAEVAFNRAVVAVESFDAPVCERTLLVARAAGMLSCAVTAVRTATSSRDDRLGNGNCPSVPGVVPLPKRRGPCFVMPTVRDQIARVAAITAFNGIRTRLPGWSLVCATGGGRWMITPESTLVQHDADDNAATIITIAVGSSPLDHVACQILLDHGVPCLTSEDSTLAARIPASLRDLLIYRDSSADRSGPLADCMLAIAALSDAQRDSVSRQLISSRLAESEPSVFVAECLARWHSIKNDASCALTLAWWQAFERSNAGAGTRAPEAART